MIPLIASPHPIVRRRLRLRLALVALLALLTVLALLPAGAWAVGPAAVLPKPANIACQGWERDTVVVSWKDTATDESNYRVERKIGGGAFTEVATITPDGSGNYAAYRDTGADVSTQNRRYRVRSFRSGDSSFSPYSDECSNRHIFENTNFRIFYGLRGTSEGCPQIDGNEACLADVNSGGSNTFVSQQANALQGSVGAFSRVGFTRDAGAPPSGLDKIPINVVWCDGGGCAGGSSLGLSPALMETPFDLVTRAGDPVAWMVAVHELFHFQQFKYGGLVDPAPKWVIEGQARSIQDKICIGANRAACQAFDDIDTGYAGYVPELKGYLGDPSRPINQTDYQAVLFWTYLTEKYGTSAPTDTVEGGMNLLVKFWEQSAASPGRDGISVLNSALATLGHSQRFRDIWKDFAVANYAKNLSGPGVPAKYRYADMSQPGGNYGGVGLTLSQNLNLGDSVVQTGETVRPWSARYYELRPAANVPIVDIKVKQDSAVPVYYTILGIKGSDITYEYNTEARDLGRTLVNDGYDKVVVIVAGLENLANYRYSFNGTQPQLRILSPTTANKARVGNPTSPDKFRVTVEAIAADGTPLAGVNLASFSFRVGAQDVPAANVLTSATVQGQQWFVLRAPAQTSAGLYDLRVRYSTILTATQSQAVDYSPRNDADSVLVIDRSGSMASNNKLTSAQAAARLYVDSWRTGDKIGVVDFNDVATVDLTVRNWTDTPSGGSRQAAFNQINGLTATGGTAIGDGLRKGWDQLNASGNASHDWALVLLSDGLETAGTESLDTLIAALTSATGKRPVVHTIAVGPDADRPRMQKVANDTGGSYQYVSAPSGLAAAGPAPASISDIQLNMDSRYRAIATKIIGHQQFFSLVGPTGSPGLGHDIVPIAVEGGAAELVLSLSWKASPTGGQVVGPINLIDPANNTVPKFESDTRHIIWRVPTPASGGWKLDIPSPVPGQIPLPAYLVQGSLRSDVTLDVYLTTPLAERTPGVPMGIVASLTDTGPIKSAIVVASVTTPLSSTYALPLYDDGAHGDGAANDGLYGNTFYRTGEAGSYDVAVNATGISPLSGSFKRQDTVSFHLTSAGDRDQDGLPDEWEQRYGTNPGVNDAQADPDNDGSNNAQEWQRGTNPTDSDTDNGGEADGTDTDPLNPADDRIQPTWGVVYPGIGKVFIKYPLRPQYQFVRLFRGTNPKGPFTFLMQNSPGTGVLSDTQVVNGTTYCYIVLGLDAQSHLSAGGEPSCTTPKTDPLAPHGWVIINKGVRAASSATVQLTLWASDAIDPEVATPDDALLLPPADSASGVTQMMISNRADMKGGVWEPYATIKTWTLDWTSSLPAVFVKYRDAAGNESAVAAATIHLNQLFLPVIRR